MAMKYKLLKTDTKEIIEKSDNVTTKGEALHNVTTIYRIRATRDIPKHNIHAGDLGGYIESEDCLSQLGDCWIDRFITVLNPTRVKGDALVGGTGTLKGHFTIS